MALFKTLSFPLIRNGACALQRRFVKRKERPANREGHSVQKHQRPLTYEEKQRLKSIAMQRELNRQINAVVIGREGLSPNILGQITRILEKHELVKVKMMLTCRMDQMEVRDKIQDMTDSVMVLGMGLKLFFYRDNDLPRLPYTIGPRPYRKPR